MFRVKNTQGLFVSLNWVPLISVSVLHKIQVMADEHPNEREKAQMLEALAAVQCLPCRKSHMILTDQDPGFDGVIGNQYQHAKKKEAQGEYLSWGNHSNNFIQHGYVEAYGFADIYGVKGASDPGCEFGSPHEAGWLSISAVAKTFHVLTPFLHKVQHGHIRDHILSKWLTVSKKIKNYTFQSVDEEQEWSCCEAWMVFGKSGYLDDKGQCAPLSRARMFESAAAAIRTVKSKKWTSWKVVKARVEAVGLEKFPGDTEDDRLSGAMARQEEKKLMAALENASIEQLKERLSALEGPSHMEADEVKKSTRARL